MTAVLVGVGGTGQHVALAALRLHAMGALPRSLELVIVDPDNTQPLTQRLAAPWPRSAQEEHPLRLKMLSPFDAKALGNIHFGNLFVDANHPEEQLLFESFFDAEEEQVPIAHGMQAMPLVGASVISEGVKTDGMQQTLRDLGNREEIVVAGSLIGGTGAGVAHKLLHALRGSHPKIHLHALLFTRWFQTPAAGPIAAAIPINEAHGLEYVYRHTLPLVDNACVIGVPTVAGKSTLARAVSGPAGQECPSLLHLVAARALLDLPAKRISVAATKVWAYAHDDENEDWVLDLKWDGDRTLQSRFNVVAAAEKVIGFLVGIRAELHLHVFPTFLEKLRASPEAVSRSLHDSIRNHAGTDVDRGREFIDACVERWRAHLARYELCRSWLVGLFPSLATGRGATPWGATITQRVRDDSFMREQLVALLGPPVAQAQQPLGPAALADVLVARIESASLPNC